MSFYPREEKPELLNSGPPEMKFNTPNDKKTAITKEELSNILTYIIMEEDHEYQGWNHTDF